MIPFFARNQFKEKLLKMLDEATKDKTKKKQHGLTQFKDLSDRIDALFNTGSSSQGDAKKLSINIVGHVDTMDSMNAYLRMQNTKAYMRANLEGQKLVSKFSSTKCQYQLDYRLFQQTANNFDNAAALDTFQQSCKQSNVTIKESTIMFHPDSCRLPLASYAICG